MQADEDRDEAAAGWFATLRGGPMSLERRMAFDRWRADPANQRALEEMQTAWDAASILKQAPARSQRDRPPRWAALAAALALVVLGAGVLGMLSRQEPARIVTAVGEQRTQELTDGSVVAVNVASRLRIVDGEDARVVALEDGEAAFFVRSEADRPFIVQAGDYELRAMGTAFNVRLRGDVLEVAVSEGRVAVCTQGADPSQALAIVNAGEVVRLPAAALAGVATAVTPELIAPARVAEWRMRVVTYRDASVSDVVDDLNRFFARPLRIADPELAARRLTVRLEVADRQSAVNILTRMLDARIEPERRADMLVAAESEVR